MAFFKGVPVAISGTGMYVPDRVLTNEDLSRMVDTSDEWIRERTGIRRRHIAEAGELTSEVALKAESLEAAGLAPSEIDW